MGISMGSIRPFNAPWCSPHALELLRRTGLASGAGFARLDPRPDCALRRSAPSVATLAGKRPCSSRARVRRSARRRRDGRASRRTCRRIGSGIATVAMRSIVAPRCTLCRRHSGTAASRRRGGFCTRGRRRAARSTSPYRPSGTHDNSGYLAFGEAPKHSQRK